MTEAPACIYIPQIDPDSTEHRLREMVRLPKGPTNKDFLEAIADVCVTLSEAGDQFGTQDIQVSLQVNRYLLDLHYRPQPYPESLYTLTDGMPEFLRRLYFRVQPDGSVLSFKAGYFSKGVVREALSRKTRRAISTELLTGYLNSSRLTLLR